MRVAFYTLGCKVNHYETAAMAELFTAAGHQVVDFSEKADAYVVNTCTVTAVADQKSRQMLSRAHAQSPDTLIVAVGCYSEVAKEKVASLPGVDLVLGTGGRKDIVPLVEQALLGQKPDPAAVPPFSRRQFEDLSAVADSRTRATLKVQDGCVSFCTYCAIPFARGALRSRSMESCRRELTTLTEKGYREIVLTGIELTEYGKDLADRPTLNDLIRLSDECGVERLRLGSLDPRFADEAFAQTCAQSRSLCHQFHLSLQSGSDTVLARMNRRYTAAEYLRNADRLRAPDRAALVGAEEGERLVRVVVAAQVERELRFLRERHLAPEGVAEAPPLLAREHLHGEGASVARGGGGIVRVVRVRLHGGVPTGGRGGRGPRPA